MLPQPCPACALRSQDLELSAEELAELDAAMADADDTVIPHDAVLAELDRIIANR
jgi:hypothetical protein